METLYLIDKDAYIFKSIADGSYNGWEKEQLIAHDSIVEELMDSMYIQTNEDGNYNISDPLFLIYHNHKARPARFRLQKELTEKNPKELVASLNLLN